MSAPPLRVLFNYRTIEGPWGGANSFLRGLKRAFRRTGAIAVVDDEREPYDVLFINQLGRGPGRPKWRRRLTTPGELERISTWGSPSRWHAWLGSMGLRERAGKPIVCRLVNLVEHAYGVKSRLDSRLLEAVGVTDVDVFQSHYVREVFRAAGYAKPGSRVIYNGTDQQVFSLRPAPRWNGRDPLRVYSCTFATRASKRFDVIAAVSECPGVESFHIGSWPADVSPKRVTLLGKQSPEACAALYRDDADVFLHPAQRDICPNVVIEALSSGLPVLFDPHGGTSELVKDCGVAIDGTPQAALEQVRAHYGELTARVHAQHERFSSDRAAAEYAQAFRDAYQHGPGAGRTHDAQH